MEILGGKLKAKKIEQDREKDTFSARDCVYTTKEGKVIQAKLMLFSLKNGGSFSYFDKELPASKN